MKRCGQCGLTYDDDKKFCRKCGKKIETVDQSSAAGQAHADESSKKMKSKPIPWKAICIGSLAVISLVILVLAMTPVLFMPKAVPDGRYDRLTTEEYKELAKKWKPWCSFFHSARAYENLALATLWYNADSAKAIIKEGLTYHPESATLLALKSRNSDRGTTENSDAISYLKKAHLKNKKNPEVLLMLVICCMKVGDAEHAQDADRLLIEAADCNPFRTATFDQCRKVLQSLPANAILFTGGPDTSYFPYLIIQKHEHIQPDVSVINISLLNTDGYSSYLKKTAPGIKIGLSESQISAMDHQRNSFISPTPYVLPITKMQLTLPSRNQRQFLFISDKMLLNIIDANYLDKPVFFTKDAFDEATIFFNSSIIDTLGLKMIVQRK